MDALLSTLAAFFAAHHYLALGLGLYVTAATLVNTYLWPKRASMKAWEKYLHLALVDLPSLLASPGYRGYLGRLGVPFFSVSRGLGADDATLN